MFLKHFRILLIKLTKMEKIYVVTGANSGIGRATAERLAQTGNKVILVCRNPQKGKKAIIEIGKATKNNKLELFLCDLSSHQSIREFATKFRNQYGAIDVLVNNAGGIFGERILTEEGREYTFALNHLGYFLMTHYLLDLLKQPDQARIVNVASDAHRATKMDFDNLEGEKKYKQMTAYALSKMCNILFTRELAVRLQGTNIITNCLHPGVVATNFGNSGGGFLKNLLPMARKLMINSDKGADTSVFLALAPEVEKISGEYFAKMKVKKSTKDAANMDYAKRLWARSLQLTGIETFGETGSLVM